MLVLKVTYTQKIVMINPTPLDPFKSIIMNNEIKRAPIDSVDLRSDTLTKPSEGMREAMAKAIVGDDVFGEDPTVNKLQERAAELMGMEAALFVPSGTMANQIAMLTHCRRGDEVIVGWGAHSFLYESGGGAVLAGVQFQQLGMGGYYSPFELQAAIHEEDPSGHCAPTTLIMIENTHNRGGGKWISPEQVAELAIVAQKRGVKTHIDGARLWNAATASGRSPREWGVRVDSLTFCLSKGLGAPIGSVLCGSQEWIARAHRYRKMLGGGMRQAGVIAAAGLYALEHQVEDLAKDHQRAQALAEAINDCENLEINLESVHSNIVLFTPLNLSPKALCERLSPDVRVLPFGAGQVRAVLHRDITDDDLNRTIEVIKAKIG